MSTLLPLPTAVYLYLSIMRLGAAKDTEITRIEPRWLVNWRHQTLQSQIVRPLESIAETQPQLQPALLRLSVMISRVLHAGCFYLELIADAGRINSRPA